MASPVSVTEYAETFIKENVNSRRVYERIVDCMRIIGEYPQIGRVYDPEYPAARPPFPCRALVVSDTPFTIYYTYDLDDDAVTVISVEYSAGNPASRFTGFF